MAIRGLDYEYLQKILQDNPIDSQTVPDLQDAIVQCVFLRKGSPFYWIIIEGNPMTTNCNYMLFGYCHVFEWEWGTVTLKELLEYATDCFMFRKTPIKVKEVVDIINKSNISENDYLLNMSKKFLRI